MSTATPKIQIRNHVIVGARLLALTAGCALAACGPGDPAESVLPKHEAVADSAPQNCIFIILDTASARHFSYMGYERATTPEIDAFASESVVFSQASSATPSTQTSAHAYLTGQYSGLPANPAFSVKPIGPDEFSMAEAFRDAGYRTAGYSANPWISAEFGFERGFEVFEHFPSREYPPESRKDQVAGWTQAILDEAAAWAEGAKDEPFFLYLHLLRPHNPYHAPKPFRSKFNPDGYIYRDENTPLEAVLYSEGIRWGDPDPDLDEPPLEPDEIDYMRDLYDGNLAYADHLVGAFLERIESAGLLERTAVVIASDHGEAFMQHGFLGHNRTVYEDMIHVPLIVRMPSNAGPGPGTVNTPVSLLDLFPTFVDLFGIEAKQALHGRSLMPALRGEGLAVDALQFAQTHENSTFAVRRGDWKLLFAEPEAEDGLRPAELYNLASDPGETSSVLEQTPGAVWEPLVSAAEIYWSMHWTAPKKSVDMEPVVSEETVEQLQSLGYLGDH